jgi:lactate permease
LRLAAHVEVWPAVLVAAVSFAVAQLLISGLHGPWLTSIGSAVASILALVGFLRIWKPKRIMHVNEAPLSKGDERSPEASLAAVASVQASSGAVWKAWMPWLLLSALVFLWGLPSVKAALDEIFRISLPFAGLDQMVQRVPPVVSSPAIEKAVYNLNLLSATGTAILFSGIIGGLLLGAGPREIFRTYVRTLKIVAPSLLTIAAMLALGYLTRYSGVDATLGLAFAMTGTLYPFFGTLLGWLGVAVTGSDTSSNVLFGSLQKITAEQLGLSPILMAGANSSGGVMGKMIDAQSIVVASTATRWYGNEGRILRYVFVHSIVLAALVGLVVLMMAYVPALAGLTPGR